MSLMKELCPHCLDFIDITEEVRVIREDPVCMVKKITRHCQMCNHELANTISFRFKTAKTD